MRMHATRDTLPVIKRNLAGGRVMRGVGRLRQLRGEIDERGINLTR
jgi:hypothetical protein